MTNESGQRVMEEAVGSRQEIEARLRTSVRHFAYPAGTSIQLRWMLWLPPATVWVHYLLPP